MNLFDVIVIVFTCSVSIWTYYQVTKARKEIERVQGHISSIDKRFGHIERSMEMIASRIKMKDK